MSGKMHTIERVRKNYRIRKDIEAEMQGLLKLLNKDPSKPKISETDIVEQGIALVCQRFKQKLLNQ